MPAAIEVFAFGVSDVIAMARQAGAHWGGNPDRGDVVELITRQEPAQLDVVFECCGQQEALDQGIELAYVTLLQRLYDDKIQ